MANHSTTHRDVVKQGKKSFLLKEKHGILPANMKKILKEIALRPLPAVLGLVAYLIYDPILGQYPLGFTLDLSLGPIILFIQHEPVWQCILFTLACLALISAHIIWRKWYTAPISFFGGIAWGYLGMAGAAISC